VWQNTAAGEVEDVEVAVEAGAGAASDIRRILVNLY